MKATLKIWLVYVTNILDLVEYVIVGTVNNKIGHTTHFIAEAYAYRH